MGKEGTSAIQMLVPYMYVQGISLVITVPADGLAPNGARPSTGTVMTEKLDICWFKSFGFQLFYIAFVEWMTSVKIVDEI